MIRLWKSRLLRDKLWKFNRRGGENAERINTVMQKKLSASAPLRLPYFSAGKQ